LQDFERYAIPPKCSLSDPPEKLAVVDMRAFDPKPQLTLSKNGVMVRNW
jgi:hypothetical protein